MRRILIALVTLLLLTKLLYAEDCSTACKSGSLLDTLESQAIKLLCVQMCKYRQGDKS